MKRKSAHAVYLCSWAAGLDYMPRGHQRYPRRVLKVLHECGRFSVFEATANQNIAKVMDGLVERKLIEVDNSPGYPWSKVKLTAKGKAYAGVQ